MPISDPAQRHYYNYLGLKAQEEDPELDLGFERPLFPAFRNDTNPGNMFLEGIQRRMYPQVQQEDAWYEKMKKVNPSLYNYLMIMRQKREQEEQELYNRLWQLGRNPVKQTQYKRFDPEGSEYDYETAKKYGLKEDQTKHWPSREPKTGLLLKGRKHPTWNKTVEGELQAGYEIYLNPTNKRYYSRKKQSE